MRLRKSRITKRLFRLRNPAKKKYFPLHTERPFFARFNERLDVQNCLNITRTPNRHATGYYRKHSLNYFYVSCPTRAL